MQLTDFSLQKLVQSKYEGEIHFCAASEGADILSRNHPFARVLLVLSVRTSDMFALFQPLFPNAVSMVLIPRDGVETLFAQSDDVSLVVCCGEEYAVSAARYFATVRALPCAVFACSACADSLCSSVVVSIGGEKSPYPAKKADYLFADETLLDKDSLLSAYVDIVSLRVALFELSFDALLLQTKYKAEQYEIVSSAVSACMDEPFGALKGRTLFCASLLVSSAHAAGFPRGEVTGLSATCRRLGCGALSAYYAMDKLSKAYRVFFLYGKARKYYTPPYHARVRRAAGLYRQREETVSARLSLPDVATLDAYAQVFETVRAQFFCEAQELSRRVRWVEDNIRPYQPEQPPDNALLNAALKYLPEGSAEYGITSLMRDFGLLDF